MERDLNLGRQNLRREYWIYSGSRGLWLCHLHNPWGHACLVGRRSCTALKTIGEFLSCRSVWYNSLLYIFLLHIVPFSFLAFFGLRSSAKFLFQKNKQYKIKDNCLWYNELTERKMPIFVPEMPERIF